MFIFNIFVVVVVLAGYFHSKKKYEQQKQKRSDVAIQSQHMFPFRS